MVGPLKASQGYKYLLTVKDSFTRWLEIFPLKDLKAISIARIINNEVFCRYGLPSGIKFDNALYFRAKLTADLLHLLGVQRIYSPPYNPKVSSNRPPQGRRPQETTG